MVTDQGSKTDRLNFFNLTKAFPRTYQRHRPVTFRI